ncbi:hypothetical protein ACWDFL_36920 [Streptomyces bungoensis]
MAADEAHHQRQGGSDAALPPADNVRKAIAWFTKDRSPTRQRINHLEGRLPRACVRQRGRSSRSGAPVSVGYDGRGVGGGPALLPVPAT